MFCITYIIANKYYPGGPVNVHIQSLINIIQKNNWEITTKKGKDKLPLFSANVERVIPIYDTTHPPLKIPHVQLKQLFIQKLHTVGLPPIGTSS